MKASWLSSKNYDFIYGKVPRLCVDIVIKNPQGTVLVWRKIEPAKNTWHLPGGRVMLREKVETAAVRIAKAETGLNVKPVKLLGYMEFLNEAQGGKKRHTVSLVFLAKATNPKKINSDSRFFKFLPKKTHNVHKKFLLQNSLIQI